jgi:FkbM family methyltransferase
MARYIFRWYPLEYGRYTILHTIFFPYLAPREGEPQSETVRVRTGFRLKLSPREFLHATMYLFNDYDMQTVRFLHKALKDGETAANIGANIGYMTLVMAERVGTRGTVLAIEPEARNYALLEEHLALNNVRNVIALKNAVSATNGTLDLYISDINSGAHSALVNHLVDEKNVQRVEAYTFDILAERQNISDLALALIDVEGFEQEALQGMAETIRKHRPILVLELNGPLLRQRNMSVQELSDFICQTHNYVRYSIQHNGSTTPSKGVTDFENGVFLPIERASQLKF